MTTFFDADSSLPTQLSYVHGEALKNKSGTTFPNEHPGNEQKICDVEIADDIEVTAAVESAREGFKSWSSTPALERSKVLQRAASILRERNEELAQLETLDTGKPIRETREVDILTGVDVMEFFAGVIPGVGGHHLDFGPEGHAHIKREPLGVCVGIGAWNYPIQIAMWKSSPALACGNSMIFKPSELTPLTTLRLAQIYTEAGLPNGVFNVVQGNARTGELLVSHPDVDKISLTGSVPTGKTVMRQAADTLKKVTLELGGKSPIIVFDDASIENAVKAVVPANFYSTGQVCSNGTRVFVQKGVYQRFLDELLIETQKVVVGDPFKDSTSMGPLISKNQFDKVCDYFQAVKESKATILAGGKPSTRPDKQKGFFVEPTIVAGAADDMAFVKEEIFGPLMSVLMFDTEEEAVRRANNTPFGLAGAVFTNDFNRANRVANALQAGNIWINHYHLLPASLPFGGFKSSGIGRENGLAAIDHYTQIKTIYSYFGDVESSY